MGESNKTEGNSKVKETCDNEEQRPRGINNDGEKREEQYQNENFAANTKLRTNCAGNGVEGGDVNPSSGSPLLRQALKGDSQNYRAETFRTIRIQENITFG